MFLHNKHLLAPFLCVLVGRLSLRVHAAVDFFAMRMTFAACWDQRSRPVFPVSKRLVPEECVECISLSVDLAARRTCSRSVCVRSQEGTADQEVDSQT